MTDPRIVARLKTTSAACAVFAMLVGAVALLGWITGNEVLKGSFIHGITMKTNTALGLLLAGLALWLLIPDHRSPLRNRCGQALGLLVAAIGLVTMVEHVFGVDLGIDQALFREPAGSAATISPNRMGPPASTCFPLLGFALCLIGRAQVRVRYYQPLVVVVVLLSTISILGFLYQVRELYGIASVTGIALPTAVTFLTLAFGILCARPERGLISRLSSDDGGAVLVRRLLPVAVLLPVVLSWLQAKGQEAGWFDFEFGRALSTLTFMFAFSALLWWTGNVIRRKERTSAEAQAAIHHQLTESLETRKRVIADLQESEDLFRTLGEAVPDLLWVSEPDGQPLFQNPAWRAFTGLTHEELLERGWDHLHHPDDRLAVRRLWEQARVYAAPFRTELRLRRHDGVYRWCSSQNVPVKDADGHVAKWVGTLSDIEDRKQSEAQLRDTDRRKNEFLATLAHELRNPLAPVRHSLQLLRQRKFEEHDVQWAISVMDRQVDHLVRLIDDLVDVSRISHNKLELRRSRVSVAEIVAGAIESARPLIDANEHQLEVQLPEEELVLDADAVRLAQVFLNLLANSAKYTPRGGRIRLVAEREGSDVVVRVSDTGIGIASDQMPHLFEMFFQTEGVLNRSQGGLGIGLALVRHLVQLHGGSVIASSAGLAQGSTFTVRLPLARDPAGASPRVVAPGSSLPRLGDMRILVVDDNEDAATSLSILLRMAGAEVHTAHDGEQALARARETEPSIVLLDIGLPKMNGYQVAEAIRREPWGGRTVLVALTGWGQPEDRERSRQSGFDHHLVKPVSPENLFELLARTSASPV